MRYLGLVVCFMCGAISTLRAQAINDVLAEGRRHMAEGRLPEAVDAYRLAVKVDSASVVAWRGLANALHRMERYPEALDALERAAALAPQDVVIRFNRALALSELGRFEAAFAELDTVVRARPDLAPAWTERGAASALLGRLAEARADWRRALELSPNYVWSRYYRAQAAIRDGDYRAAAADLDSVTQREGLLAGHLWRWVAYRLDGRAAPPLPSHAAEWPGPIAAFLRGEMSDTQLLTAAQQARIAIDDRRLASAYFFIGQKHLAEGRPSEARAALARALGLNVPRHAEVVAAEALLSRLAPSPARPTFPPGVGDASGPRKGLRPSLL